MSSNETLFYPYSTNAFFLKFLPMPNNLIDSKNKRRINEGSISNVITPSPINKKKPKVERREIKGLSYQQNLLVDFNETGGIVEGKSILERDVVTRQLQLAKIYSTPLEAVPYNDVCFNCRQSGHWSRECPGLPGMTAEETRLNKLEHKAEFNSTCAECSSPVTTGELVIPMKRGVWSSSEVPGSTVWVHKTCWRDKIALTVAHQENQIAIQSRVNPEVENILVRVNSGKSTIVSSVAGSGKTELLTTIYRQSSDSTAKLALAFNKSAAEELRARGVQTAMTFHSYGYRILKEFSKQGRLPEISAVNQNKMKELLTMWCRETGDVSNRKNGIGPKTQLVKGAVIKLLSLAKANGLGIPGMTDSTKENLHKLYNHYGVTSDCKDDVLNCTLRILKMSIELAKNEGNIDFDDQIYMPLQLRKPGERFWDGKYALILVDEAQDASKIRIELVAKSMPKGGQVVAVGDQLQTIYGYAGAASDSLSIIQESFKTGEPLSLSVSWRLPSLHADYVNDFLVRHADILRIPGSVPSPRSSSVSTFTNHVKAKPYADSGLLVQSQGTFTDYPIPSDESRQDSAVICRTNAPLVHLYYALAKRNIVARLLGRKEIGSGMKKQLAKALKQYALPDRHIDSINCAVDALRILRRDVALRDDECDSDGTNYNDVDLIDCVLSIIECLHSEAKKSMGCQPLTLDDLKQRLSEFSTGSIGDGPYGRMKYVTLCSIHKAKGMGFHRVYILQPLDLPLPIIMAKGARWQKEQELHVAYVAYTRAYSDLIFLRHVDIYKKGKSAMDELWDKQNYDDDKVESSLINFN
jgi:superfamily I DNA/RNA helicase